MNGNSKRDTGDLNHWDLVPPLKNPRSKTVQLGLVENVTFDLLG
jgi:hypothetical protein